MADSRQYELLILQYVPRAVRRERVNLGLLLMGGGFADMRMTTDWRRLECIDPDVDIEVLQGLGRDIQKWLKEADGLTGVTKLLSQSFSGAVEVLPAEGVSGGEPAEEIEKLARIYLERPPEPGKRELGPRQRILSAMQRSFEDAGVWKHMLKEIAVSRYTETGDPLKIDCGYRPNGIIKMFHAVPLSTNPELAKILAYSYAQMSDGVKLKEQASASLTAVVEDGLYREEPKIAFALGTLERAQIAVAEVGSMPGIAEQARVELRL